MLRTLHGRDLCALAAVSTELYAFVSSAEDLWRRALARVALR